MSIKDRLIVPVAFLTILTVTDFEMASAKERGQDEPRGAQAVRQVSVPINQQSEAVSQSELDGSATVTAGVQSPSVGSVWQVVSGGGTVEMSSTDYRMFGTIGQSVAGVTYSSSNELSSGFWQNYGIGGPCDVIPGDADDNSSYNILDPAYILNFLYRGGPPPEPFELLSGDPNCDCTINILDVAHIINYLDCTINILDVAHIINYLYRDGAPPCGCENWVANCSLPFK